MIDLAALRTMAARLPGVEEGTSYGTPGFRVGKRLFVRMHQREDAIVVLLNSVEEQQALLARDPLAYYVTDHYQGYGAVLVRPTLDEEAFFALLTHAWRRVARKKDLAAFTETPPDPFA